MSSVFTTRSILFLSTLTLFSGTVFAQSGTRNLPPAANAGTGAGTDSDDSSGSSGGGNGGATTAVEGYLRGRADLLRAAGEALPAAGQALKYREQARRQYIQNQIESHNVQIAAIQARTARYQALAEYNRARRANRPSPEAIRRISQALVPKRLTPAAFDPDTGRINWPPALMRSSFGATRSSLDQLFYQWARDNSQVGSRNYVEIRGTISALRQQLANQVRRREIDPASFVSARRYLDSLSYESQRPLRKPQMVKSDTDMMRVVMKGKQSRVCTSQQPCSPASLKAISLQSDLTSNENSDRTSTRILPGK